jgi:hypothetical protein
VSKTGRDKGRLFVIVGVESDRIVQIADGECHGTARPKRKNVKHLIILEQVDSAVSERLEMGLPITDDQLVTALRAYKPHDEKGGDLRRG